MANKIQKIGIVHIITSLENTGIALMLYKLLAHADRHQFEPIVISLGAETELCQRIRAHGITVHALEMSTNLVVGWQIFKLTQLLRTLKPDVIQGWMYHGNLAASLANLSLGNRLPVLWNIHNTLYDIKQEPRTTRWVIELTVKRSNTPVRTLYNTYLSAEQHATIGYDTQHTQVVPNGIDTQLFSPNAYSRDNIRQMLGIPQDAIVIGMVAHHQPLKNHALFIEAAHLLLHHQKNVHFILAGEGITADNPQLAPLLQRISASAQLHLLGERKDIPNLLNALDIYSLPASQDNGFPHSVGEAMACGIPCLTTDVGDLPRIIGNTGRTLQQQEATPSALAFAWLEWIHAGEVWRKELGVRAMQRIQQHYNIQDVTQQYQTIYKEVVNHGRTDGVLLPFQPAQFSRHAEQFAPDDGYAGTQRA
jgi:glycosyltransferase involved in cell wall biosynthesis